MKTYIQILTELKNESSTNNKINIIRENKENIILREIFNYTLNPAITFGIKEFNYNIGNGQFDDIRAWGNFKSLLDQLSKREITGNLALNKIQETFSWFNKDQCKWFEKILKRDFSEIGLGRSIVDKAFETQTKFKLMLAESEDVLDKIEDKSGVLNKKANGVRTIVIIEDGKVSAIYGGRNGLIADNFYFIKDELEFLHSDPLLRKSIVLDGETHVLDCLEDTMSLYGFKFRDKSEFIGKSGKLKNKAYSDYLEDEKRILDFQSKAKFTIFDVMTLEDWNNQKCELPLSDRIISLNTINIFIKKFGLEKIEIIESEFVNSKQEAIEAAQEWIERGFEGGIYKPLDGLYEWRRSKNWIKIKEVCDFEIQFTHYEIQKDKFDQFGNKKPDMVGAIFGIDKDGNEYKIGTGKALDEKTRIDMLNNWDSNYKDKIGTCSAQRPSGKGKYICPRLDIIRIDRNSLED